MKQMCLLTPPLNRALALYNVKKYNHFLATLRKALARQFLFYP